ncbi:RNA polymerase sigma-70 factor (ECF subfamily) [Flavobacterium sp. 7E]|uniref:RNA polymerase sigma factor n=1 Tax=Flavobacterium sp. 7E TaxID=2735898 RepID=UPI0015701259|nr:sigma-70 family RNA polymerase sigma factor [Flavobacterium sp. 7E]NRS88917.1 RNA polymerase sigma-70 factor (ECF subfamily) [Flavobacterium sp. 7E]
MKLASKHIDELIALCKKNDQKAQFEIYNRYSKAMYNVAFRIVKDYHFAEDIMQEGFLKAFIKIDSYKNEVAFGAWLKRIIVNCSIDFYKQQNKYYKKDFDNLAVTLVENDNDFIDSASFNELKVQQILATLQTMKESYSMVLTLFYIEGYDQEEISEILNISYANCRTTLCRAKENLRSKLMKL